MRLPKRSVELLVAMSFLCNGAAIAQEALESAIASASLRVEAMKPPANSTGSAATVRTTINVEADAGEATQGGTDSFHANSDEILSSAGTFGDFSRYLQMFPGVVFNSDESNDILVRGGNPIENLYLVDGFPVPNINHISTLASTGGLVAMIDTAATQNVDLLTGGYNASYDERLSSVVEIHTRNWPDAERHLETDVGIVGVGGIGQIPLSSNGSLLLSAHRSVLNLFTDDIGLNGVPIYTNELARARLAPTGRDQIEVLSLGGLDSIGIHPNPLDPAETNPIDTQYGGWRMTNGTRWQHLFKGNFSEALGITDSEQHGNIDQESQLPVSGVPTSKTPNSSIPIYSEVTNEGTTTLSYDLSSLMHRKFTIVLGSQARVTRVNYSVSQPIGEMSPFSADPQLSDATSFNTVFSTCASGTYAQATWQIYKPLSVSVGGRVQTFALGGYVTETPRASVSYALTDHVTLHASVGKYVQLPPIIYVVSFPQNRDITPIHVRHLLAGADLWKGSRGKLTVEGYSKNYAQYPVSTEYPTLSLANIVDTLGQQYIWLPMTSEGRGVAHGVELYGEAKVAGNFFGQASLAYSRTKFSGLDGVLRSGNFDYPVIINAGGNYHLQHGYGASFRYEYSTGRPYTPFLLKQSVAQDRGIYDLGEVNALRGPVYSRLDFQVNKSVHVEGKHLVLYAGLENALNRENFLGYLWMPRCVLHPKLTACDSADAPYTEAYQMMRFPNFGLRFLF